MLEKCLITGIYKKCFKIKLKVQNNFGKINPFNQGDNGIIYPGYYD